MLKLRFTLVLTLTVLTALGSARLDSPAGQRSLSWEVLDGNNIQDYMLNDGMIITHQVMGRSGLTWPPGTENSMIYAGGPWLAGMVDGEIRTAVVEYDSELEPGRIVNGIPDWPGDPIHRIFKLEAGDTESQNYLEWPANFGAPTESDGSPLVPGSQVAWWVANDGTPSSHYIFGTQPLMVEEQTFIMVFNEPGVFQDLMIVDITMINHGPTINDAYAGIWMDPDLGDANDDFVGYDTDLEMGYAWNDGTDAIFGYQTPATGCILLQTPEQDGEEVGITAFAKYINGGGDNWGDPNDAQQAYNYLQGLNAVGDPFINPITGDTTTFIHPGDPVTGAGWIDPDSHTSGDRRFLLSSGPFEFTAADTQHLSFALIIAQGYDYLNSIDKLRNESANLMDFIANGIAVDIIAENVYPLAEPVYLSSSWISRYADEGITLYNWDFLSVPDGSTASLSPENGEASFSTELPGIYTVQLEITTSGGHTASAVEFIEVVENHPPVAAFTLTDSLITFGEGIEADPSLTYDPDNDDLAYFWTQEYSEIIQLEDNGVAIFPQRTGFHDLNLYVHDQYYQDVDTKSFTITPRLDNLVLQDTYFDPLWLQQNHWPFFHGDTIVLAADVFGICQMLVNSAGNIEVLGTLELQPYSIPVHWQGNLLWTFQGNSVSIFHVDDLANPIPLLTSFRPNSDPVFGIWIMENYTVLRHYGQISFVDFDDPSDPAIIGTHVYTGYQLQTIDNTDTHLILYGYAIEPYVYRADIIDITSREFLGSLDFSSDYPTMGVVNNHMVLGNNRLPLLRIYDMADPLEPELTSTIYSTHGDFPIQNGYHHPRVLEDNIFALSRSVGYEIWSLEDPVTPEYLGGVYGGQHPYYPYLHGGQLYLMDVPSSYGPAPMMGLSTVQLVPLGVDGQTAELPDTPVLFQNYPNPFNPSTTISYEIPAASNVSLVIYDLRGNIVQTLGSAPQAAGRYTVDWNGETVDGKTLCTGIYFARLVAGDHSRVIKMLYLK